MGSSRIYGLAGRIRVVNRRRAVPPNVSHPTIFRVAEANNPETEKPKAAARVELAARRNHPQPPRDVLSPQHDSIFSLELKRVSIECRRPIIAKNQNTFAKRQREMEKRRKAEEKRKERVERKAKQKEGGTPDWLVNEDDPDGESDGDSDGDSDDSSPGDSPPSDT